MGGKNSVEVFKNTVNKVSTEVMYTNVQKNSKNTKLSQLVNLKAGTDVIVGNINMSQAATRVITSISADAFKSSSMAKIFDGVTENIKQSMGEAMSGNTDSLHSTVRNTFHNTVNVDEIVTNIDNYIQSQRLSIEAGGRIIAGNINVSQNLSEIKKDHQYIYSKERICSQSCI